MIRGVIFDLGGTLIARARTPLLNFERGNAEALRRWLRVRGARLDAGFVEALVAERAAKFAQRAGGTREIKAEEALRPVLARYGQPTDDRFVASAEAAFFEPELREMRLLPGARNLLVLLAARGLRLGLASNASSHYFIVECCRRLGLDRFLDPILSSAAVGWGKPDPKIFEAILQPWAIPPQAAVMVGDTVDADIAGARHLGMRAVLLTAEHGPGDPKEMAGIRADAAAATLVEVGRIIERWIAATQKD